MRNLQHHQRKELYPVSSIHRQTVRGSKMSLAFGPPMGFSASTATAAPYAVGLTRDGGTISFVMNESADRVKVILDGGAGANDPGELPEGMPSFSRGRATDATGHNPFSLNHAA